MENLPSSEELAFAKDCSQLHILREKVEAFMQKLPMDEKRKMRMILCVDEAAANIMEHGEPAQEGAPLSFWVQLCCEEGFFKVIFKDNGKPFDPTQAPLVDLKKHIRSGKKGGLGVHIMRVNLDIFDYDREDDKNHFILGMSLLEKQKNE
jgi:anti-sigma regulatory factor (Ser/Thr protein kinase)